MNKQDTLFILTALLEETDPTNGQQLNHPLFRRRDFKQALTFAQQALRSAAEPSVKTQRPANAGKPWTTRQDRDLTDAFANGKTVPVMAAEHERSVAAIEARLIHHGLLKPEDATSRIRF